MVPPLDTRGQALLIPIGRCFSSGASLKQPARMYYGLRRNCDTFVGHSRLTLNSKPPRGSLFNQIELAASMPFGKIVAAHSFRCTATDIVWVSSFVLTFIPLSRYEDPGRLQEEEGPQELPTTRGTLETQD